MEGKHRIILQTHFKDLVSLSDINKLLPKLIKKGVYSLYLAEQYQDLTKSEMERKRLLFAAYNRRGPEAFAKLIEALKEIKDNNHYRLACMLEGKEFSPKYAEISERFQNSSPPLNQFLNFKVNDENLSAQQISNFSFPHNMEQTETTSQNHNLSNKNCTIPEDETNSCLPQTHSGAHPFKLTDAQRPEHIRQLSLENPNALINITDEPLKVNVTKAKQFFDDQSKSKVPMYRMRGKYRGAYLGINNMEFINDSKAFRKGAQIDEENLKELFKQMGFSISNFRNQTKYCMEQIILNFANPSKNPDLKRADCIVIAIMSHGETVDTEESSYVVTNDNKLIAVSWILQQFNNINCKIFANKPKIFFFQICRGDNLHYGIKLGRTQADGAVKTPGYIIREMTDMLIAFSTLPGNPSYRDKYLGTWYIQLVCEVFMQHAHDTDIEHLLKMVDEKLKNIRSEDGNMQTSSYESRAFKRCFLHPGLYE